MILFKLAKSVNKGRYHCSIVAQYSNTVKFYAKILRDACAPTCPPLSNGWPGYRLCRWRILRGWIFTQSIWRSAAVDIHKTQKRTKRLRTPPSPCRLPVALSCKGSKRQPDRRVCGTREAAAGGILPSQRDSDWQICSRGRAHS